MNVYFIAAALALPSLASANCNLKLAEASGKYLVELEKANLQEFQSGGACKVLDAEVKKCSKKEKSKLARSVNLNEVLGNICMPHLPPPVPEK